MLSMKESIALVLELRFDRAGSMAWVCIGVGVNEKKSGCRNSRTNTGVRVESVLLELVSPERSEGLVLPGIRPQLHHRQLETWPAR